MASNLTDQGMPGLPVSESTHERAADIPRGGSWLRALVWLVLLAAAGGAGYYWQLELFAFLKPGANKKASPPPPRVPSVLATKVQRGDMDLYLNGLGTVTAFYTVTIRSRVDGELQKVHFKEGQFVKQGEMIAEIDPRPYQVMLAQAEGQLAKDRAALQIAELDLDRYNALIASGSISKQQYDAQKSLVKQNEGAIATDQAQIENAKLQLTYCKIISPLGGRIGLRIVDPGNMVRANDQNGLAVVTQLQPIAVVFTIPQDDISRVQRKMNASDSLTVLAYDREFNTKLATGKLAAIDNQVDPTTGTVRLKAIFLNEDSMLFPNQFVNARLLIETRQGVAIVPAAAVQRGPSFPFVYVVKPDETVELREVTVGPNEGDRMLIERGLEAGELVVTDGLEKLQDGAKLAVRDPSGGKRKDNAKDVPRAASVKASP